MYLSTQKHCFIAIYVLFMVNDMAQACYYSLALMGYNMAQGMDRSEVQVNSHT